MKICYYREVKIVKKGGWMKDSLKNGAQRISSMIFLKNIVQIIFMTQIK